MKRFILTLLIILYSSSQVIAQRFPITVIPQVNPPAPVNLYNYADATTINSPLRVQLLLNDITISNEQIRLKVYFEGNGIIFESRDVVIGASSLFIDGGVPLVLTNAELAPYFELQNIQGINSNIYGSTIPEGSYQFCFEVFDFSTGNRLSSKTCATTYIFKNEPPILNLPLKGVNIEPSEFENIVFQWTPRHINVSNVEYELSIVEIWDDFVDPQTAFLSLSPVFETTTRATSFVYGPTQPLLLPEKRYAWRVRAKALQGTEEVGLFRNEGKSEIFWFSRTSPCTVPLNVYAEPKGISKINVFWDEDPSVYQEYTIAYREADKPKAYWFTKRTNSGWATIWDLKPGTTYEYKVKGKCKYQYGTYSEVQEVTTAIAQDETSNYNCGIVPDAIAITNREPHPGLQIGERITAGDFVVTIVEIEQQSNGRITGRGYVGIPYLKFTRFGVKFDNILVNNDNQLAEGEMVTLYDPEFGEGETMTVDINTDIVETITGDQGDTNQVTVGFQIESITIDQNGAVIITGTNGEEALVPGGRDLEVVDSGGKVWTVNEEGGVQDYGEIADGGTSNDDNTEGVEGDEITKITATGVLVTFKKSGYYYFDELPEGTEDKLGKKDIYPSIPIVGGGTYAPAFKAISNLNGNDIIIAEADFKDSSITTEDIVFKTKSGVAIPTTWNGNKATLTLKKSFDYAIKKVLATVKPREKDEKYTVAGVLNLVHLGSKEFTDINVVLVPVNNATVSRSVETKIKEIYSKVGVKFNLTVGERFQISENIWDKEEPYNELNAGDSGLLAQYSQEELAINEYFKTTGDYKEDAYYVFVTDFKGVNSVTQEELAGFMPLKRQFGFVFKGSNDHAITAAHELGHGIFGLKHPFSEYQTAEKSTDFIMDYGAQEFFNHMDWKNIFAPGFKLYLFQGDEDGQAGIARYPLTPNWQPFNYKESEDYIRNKDQTNIPNGSIYGIRKGGKEYIWNGTDYAYNEEILPIHIISNNVSSILRIELYWYGNTCEEDKKYRTNWGYIKDKKGFDVNKVFDSGIFSDITLHSSLGCSGTNTGNDRYEDKCLGEDVAVINKQREELKSFIANMTSEISPIQISDVLDGKGLCITRELEYSDIEKLLLGLTKTIPNDVSEEVEEGIVKLINSTNADNYKQLYDNVLKITNNDGIKVLDKLLVELDNSFAFWRDDNANYFMETLAYVVSKLDSDNEKWNVVNAIINNKFDDLEEVDKKGITLILSSISEYSNIGAKIPAISELFINMLIEDCKNLNDYRIIFKIARKRNDNREAFAAFTQSEKKPIKENNIYFNHIGSLSWALPYYVQLNNPHYKNPLPISPERYYYWPKKVIIEYGKFAYDRNDIFELGLSTNEKSNQYFTTFLRHLDEYLKIHKTKNDNFWKKYENNKDLISTELTSILDHINLKENAKSLRRVTRSTKLRVLEEIFGGGIDSETIDPIYKDIGSDALMKIALSFRKGRNEVISKLEEIGLTRIYNNLSGDRLSKFLAWMGQQAMDANSTKPLTIKEVEQFESASQKGFNDEKILKLEANIFHFDNFSSNIVGKKDIKAGGNTIPYNKMVLVYVADDFTFLGQTFKKGTVLNIPIVHAFAMSNSNWNTVAKKSAWLTADVLSFAIGVGAIKIVFTTGNLIRKAIVVSDVAGTTLGAVTNALNEGAISKEVRTNMQLISMIMSAPLLLSEIKKVDDLILRTDNAIDNLSGISNSTRTTLKNYLKESGSQSLRAKEIIAKIKKSNPNCK